MAVRSPGSRFWLRLLLFVCGFAGMVSVCAQESPKSAGAIKLPDGTVVFYTQNPNDVAPKIDGVVLSAKEYQQLLEQAEQLKNARESRKPGSPSVTRIRGKVDTKNGKPVAKLTLEYAFRTTQPRTPILLGGQRAAPTSAQDGDGKLPLLEWTADGLVAVVERPGEHKLTVEFDAAIGPRGTKTDTGFELGLPRSAITSLIFEPPVATLKTLTVGTRTPDASATRPLEIVRSAEDVTQFLPKPMGTGAPLGPIDWLEVSWDTPAKVTAVPVETTLRTETEIATLVEESQIETTTRLKLRGPAREWLIAMPKDATVTATTATAERPTAVLAATATITRPADSKQPWKILTPDSNEWQVTSVVRQARPNAKDAKYAGPYTVPIAMVQGLPQQSGIVRVAASSTIHLWNFKPSGELRRLEPGGGQETLTPTFQFSTANAKPPTLEFDARPARGFTSVRPHHHLSLNRNGWHLKTELQVVPSRSTVEQIAFTLPAGWGDPTVGPDQLVDEVLPGKPMDGKQPYTVRLTASKTESFTLTLNTQFPLGVPSSELALLLPRFNQVSERETQLQVVVPNEWSVTATAVEGGPNPNSQPLQPVGGPKPGTAITNLAGTFDTPIAQLQLAWQPYRAELTANLKAELTLGERQLSITQTIQFQANDSITRPIRLTGPVSPLAFQANPPVEPIGNGIWEIPAPRDAKELTFQVTYSVPIPPRSGANSTVSMEVPLVWPDATKMTASVRVWGTLSGSSRRPVNVRGAWEERPPEPSADKDSLPTLTLRATGVGKGVPLTFDLVDYVDASSAVIERAAIQHVIHADGTILGRSRFLLKRWPPNGVDLELACTGMPTVYVNRERVENLTPVSNGDESIRVYRVPFPESKLNRSATLEVQYHCAPQLGYSVQLAPPRIRNAVLLSPTWWHIGVPAPMLPLLMGRGWGGESRWNLRSGIPSLQPAVTANDLDNWFQTGTPSREGDPWSQASESAITTRQTNLVTLQVVLLPRTALQLTCAMSSFLLAILFVFHPTANRWLIRVLLVVALAFVIGLLFAQQPTLQLLSVVLPGLLAAVVVAVVLSSWQNWRNRRAAKAATFRREPVPSVPGESIPPGTAEAGKVRQSNGVVVTETLKAPSSPLAPPATG